MFLDKNNQSMFSKTKRINKINKNGFWVNDRIEIVKELTSKNEIIKDDAKSEIKSEIKSENKNCAIPKPKKNTKIFKRGRWTKREDKKLKKLVSNMNLPDWKEISKNMDNRLPDQCKERYSKFFQTRKPKKNKWNFERQIKFFEHLIIYQNSWVSIAKEFKFKSENRVKNFFYISKRYIMKTPFFKIVNLIFGNNLLQGKFYKQNINLLI